jgi:YggT family protein
MDIIIVPLLKVLLGALDLFQTFLFVYIILGWLEAFSIVNRYNQFVYTVHTFLFRLIEPVLSPIRRRMPDLGGIDLSPLIVLFGVYFIHNMVDRVLVRFPA